MSARQKKKDCKCTSQPKGNPKYSDGCCYHSGDVKPSVRERKHGKEYCRDWTRDY